MMDKHWWTNREFLSRYDIDSMEDPRHFQVHFKRQYFQDGICRSEHVSIDRETLVEGRFDMRDLLTEFKRVVESAPDYQHPGPTNQDLRDPRLSRIWSEFLMMKALIGHSPYLEPPNN